MNRSDVFRAEVKAMGLCGSSCVVLTVCRVCGISTDEFVGHSKHPSLVRARRVAVVVLRLAFNDPFALIAGRTGAPGPSTPTIQMKRTIELIDAGGVEGEMIVGLARMVLARLHSGVTL